MSKKYFRGLASCLFTLIVCSVFGQFNIKVGYTGNYINLEKAADMFERYSAQFNDQNKVLKPANYHNGIELGARYVFADHIGLDFGITSARGSNEVNGITVGSTDSFDSEWKSSLSNLYVGLENYYGWFGYGATIGYQQLKYRNKTSITSENIEILKQNALTSRFYLIIESVSDNTSFSLRPFVSLSWESYNLQDLELALFPDSTTPPNDFNEDMMVFGISLLIYNGPRR